MPAAKRGLEPNFHEPKSSHGGYLHGQQKRGRFLTLDHMGAPLINQIFENTFFVA